MSLTTISAGPAAAAQCQLKQLASLDIVKSSDGMLLVPVTVDGAEGYFALTPSDSISGITARAADGIHLRRTSVPQNLTWFMGGQQVKEKVTADLKLGNAEISAYLAISYGALSSDPRVAGVLGFDLLKMMDLELDLAHGKVNLFSQDHCKGKVVYWTHSAPVAVVPLVMRGFKAQTFLFTTTLDGQPVGTQLYLGVANGQLNSLVAQKEFGIPEDGKDDTPTAGHAFKTLSADGIAIRNPTIGIYRATAICAGDTEYLSTNAASVYSPTFNRRCFGQAPFYLGYSEVKDLRMYFAFGERMLYVTAASAN